MKEIRDKLIELRIIIDNMNPELAKSWEPHIKVIQESVAVTERLNLLAKQLVKEE